ncbi:hypothetical protein A1O3_00554 [Capronia epimyces CBS 606.96]|uniref:Major facilitator superfamily (MFS) profile domain-containing protein n=1 Tax=Capronia epimyces CBS 606.96 TaxID=1182542 RepID=W9ZBW8_9EURO|nr:uncharacterized protein A1O3_00554 [Capronia epimyces CBS 606.96]EXJ92004.1 hypothetical protein A1O3_00554 [Capronia epimyces CBS 606.96]
MTRPSSRSRSKTQLQQQMKTQLQQQTKTSWSPLLNLSTKEHPRNWPSVRKWIVTGVLSATGFNRIMVSTIMAPALSTIDAKLDMNSVESVMAMSVFLLATAFGPLVIGPLSEVYGRKPMLHTTNIWFLLWNVVCGFAHTKSLLIAARLLAGFGASAVYVLADGVLGDVWPSEQRGKSLGIYLLIPLLGAAVGPIVGGFITQGTTWRWMFWSTSLLQGAMILASILLFDETYEPVILERRAERLRTATGDQRFHTRAGKLSEGRSPLWVMQRSLSRPIRLLLFHPIVQVQTLLSGFSYGVLYLVLSTYSDLWTSRYNESISISGLHYLTICIGEVAGAQLGGPLMDLVFQRLQNQAGGSSIPEYHVPLMIPSAAITASGLLLYGWTAQAKTFWLPVDLGAAIFSCGMQINGMSLQAYVIDSYPVHASSASAASQLLRSLAAFGFPLFGPRMYSALGYGWGNTMMALVSIAVSLPASMFIWSYGAKLRKKALDSY